MNLFDVYPLFNVEIAKGLGSRVFDTKGNSYLDLYGGHAVISIGHSHPHYVEKLTNQLRRLGFYSNSIQNPLQVELAEKLGNLSGKEEYALFLCNSGAEAVENALKLASFHNKKKHIIAFHNAFHGRTSLAVAVTDNAAIQAAVNQNEHVSFLPLNDEEALEQAFKKNEICAVIVEGIQGVGGIHVASNSFLNKIKQLCDKNDAVFIADAVQCGYGRSGKFFSHDYGHIKADIYTLAKGMGNGFPIGGIMIAPHIKPKYGMLGTTFGGNHLACAAAIAVLEVMKDDGLVGYAAEMGTWLCNELAKIEGIKEIRGKGLMIGIELPFDTTHLREKLLYEYRIFTGSASDKKVIRLLPALNLPREEAVHFLEVFEEALHAETKAALI